MQIVQNRDFLGDRLKNYYEFPYRFYLTRRTPVIIRIDMCNAAEFTSFMKRPYDPIFMESMHNTMIALCEQIPNVMFAFTESDEICLLLIDHKKIAASQWLDGNIQKMVSISSSLATVEFNKAYTHAILSHELDAVETDQYTSRINKMVFDSRVFNIPDNEIVNYFLWRQTQHSKDSVQATGQFYFPQNQLQGLSHTEIQEKLASRGINWNDYPTVFKRGAAAIKETYSIKDEYKNETIERQRWIVDLEVPIFAQNKEYISSKIKVIE